MESGEDDWRQGTASGLGELGWRERRYSQGPLHLNTLIPPMPPQLLSKRSCVSPLGKSPWSILNHAIDLLRVRHLPLENPLRRIRDDIWPEDRHNPYVMAEPCIATVRG